MKFLLYPLKPFIISQKFGENPDYYAWLGIKGHNGLDCVAGDGQNVYAAHDGYVTFSGEDGSAGLGIVVRTDRRFEYNGEEVYFKSIYWHLKPGTIKVKAGDFVEVGQVLAGADNTGFSSGTHLHFGLKPVKQGEQDWQWFNYEQNNGYLGAIDPTPYLDSFFAQDAKQVFFLYEQIIKLLTSTIDFLKRK